MNKIRTIVVEDEQLPRLTLLQKLDRLKDEVEVVDACDNYEAAYEKVLEKQPDLLLLDIQLQGRDSIQLLDELKQTIPLPYIIFTTAYSDRKYLMSAIKFSAVDYLLKPIDKGELAAAIAKATDRAEAETPDQPSLPEKMSFKTSNGRILIAADDIAFIKADGNYAKITTFMSKDLVLENLLSLQQRLPNDIFVRVDRSTIINLSKVYRLNQQQHTCTLQSKDGKLQMLELSKSGIEMLMEMMG